MALKDTINQVRQILIGLCHDLEKAAEGNRAAAQRLRTGSIKFTKMAKVYRQESVAAEKGKKTSKKAPLKTAVKKSR